MQMTIYDQDFNLWGYNTCHDSQLNTGGENAYCSLMDHAVSIWLLPLYIAGISKTRGLRLNFVK